MMNNSNRLSCTPDREQDRLNRFVKQAGCVYKTQSMPDMRADTHAGDPYGREKVQLWLQENDKHIGNPGPVVVATTTTTSKKQQEAKTASSAASQKSSWLAGFIAVAWFLVRVLLLRCILFVIRLIWSAICLLFGWLFSGNCPLLGKNRVAHAVVLISMALLYPLVLLLPPGSMAMLMMSDDMQVYNSKAFVARMQTAMSHKDLRNLAHSYAVASGGIATNKCLSSVWVNDTKNQAPLRGESKQTPVVGNDCAAQLEAVSSLFQWFRDEFRSQLQSNLHTQAALLLILCMYGVFVGSNIRRSVPFVALFWWFTYDRQGAKMATSTALGILARFDWVMISVTSVFVEPGSLSSDERYILSTVVASLLVMFPSMASSILDTFITKVTGRRDTHVGFNMGFMTVAWWWIARIFLPHLLDTVLGGDGWSMFLASRLLMVLLGPSSYLYTINPWDIPRFFLFGAHWFSFEWFITFPLENWLINLLWIGYMQGAAEEIAATKMSFRGH